MTYTYVHIHTHTLTHQKKKEKKPFVMCRFMQLPREEKKMSTSHVMGADLVRSVALLIADVRKPHICQQV